MFRQQHHTKQNSPSSQKFVDGWLHIPEFQGWLEKVPNDPYTAKCTLCDADLKCGKSDLQKHGRGKRHLENLEQTNNQPSFCSTVTEVPEDAVRTTELKICAFLAEQNLPISAADPLVSLMKRLPPKYVMEKVTLGEQKATDIICQQMGPYFSKGLSEILQNNHFFLILHDVTYRSMKKQLAIDCMVVYCNSNLEIKEDFIGIISCSVGTATAVYAELLKLLKSKFIPIENMIGLCTDTTDSMMGHDNSFVDLIQIKCPKIIIGTCSSPVPELVSSHACQQLSKSLEELFETVYNHFDNSKKQIPSLTEFQMFFDAKPHKMLKPGQTSWLSLHQYIRTILDHWKALTLYWMVEAIEDPTDANKRAEITLKNPLMKCLAEFADYAIGLINELYVHLQADFSTLDQRQLKSEGLIKIFASNFMKESYINTTSAPMINPLNKDDYLNVDKILVGEKAKCTLKELEGKVGKEEIFNIYRSARRFYIEAISELKARFNFNSEIYKDMDFIYPCNAQNRKPTSIAEIAKKYLRGSCNFKKLDKEWQKQSHQDVDEKLDVVKYWQYVFSLKSPSGKPIYEELPKLLKLFLVLPFSNATTECTVRNLKTIKTDYRSLSNTETLTGLLHVKYGLKRKGQSAADINIYSKKLKSVETNSCSTQTT